MEMMPLGEGLIEKFLCLWLNFPGAFCDLLLCIFVFHFHFHFDFVF
jgi:hypothetical protein